MARIAQATAAPMDFCGPSPRGAETRAQNSIAGGSGSAMEDDGSAELSAQPPQPKRGRSTVANDSAAAIAGTDPRSLLAARKPAQFARLPAPKVLLCARCGGEGICCWSCLGERR
eukprot:5012316-Alexandrium_andersonii.AAC.1